MPLLYGEGEEGAFERLQEEILKKFEDHSLFLWWRRAASLSAPYSLLAKSVSYFGAMNVMRLNLEALSRAFPDARVSTVTFYGVPSSMSRDTYLTLAQGKHISPIGPGHSMSSLGFRSSLWMVKLNANDNLHDKITHLAILNLRIDERIVCLPLCQDEHFHDLYRLNGADTCSLIESHVQQLEKTFTEVTIERVRQSEIPQVISKALDVAIDIAPNPFFATRMEVKDRAGHFLRRNELATPVLDQGGRLLIGLDFEPEYLIVLQLRHRDSSVNRGFTLQLVFHHLTSRPQGGLDARSDDHNTDFEMAANGSIVSAIAEFGDKESQTLSLSVNMELRLSLQRIGDLGSVSQMAVETNEERGYFQLQIQESMTQEEEGDNAHMLDVANEQWNPHAFWNGQASLLEDA